MNSRRMFKRSELWKRISLGAPQTEKADGTSGEATQRVPGLLVRNPETSKSEKNTKREERSSSGFVRRGRRDRSGRVTTTLGRVTCPSHWSPPRRSSHLAETLEIRLTWKAQESKEICCHKGLVFCRQGATPCAKGWGATPCPSNCTIYHVNMCHLTQVLGFHNHIMQNSFD